MRIKLLGPPVWRQIPPNLLVLPDLISVVKWSFTRMLPVLRCSTLVILLLRKILLVLTIGTLMVVWILGMTRWSEWPAFKRLFVLVFLMMMVEVFRDRDTPVSPVEDITGITGAFDVPF